MQYPELLSGIKKRPGLYLGEISVTTLKAFLDGYRYGVGTNEVSESLIDFQEFLHKRYKVNPVFSWDKIVRLYSASDRESFDLFFKLFEDYMREFSESEIEEQQNKKD